MANKCKKLTLVSAMCRNKVVSGFFNLTADDNGNYRLTEGMLDYLFYDTWGFIPVRGETISIW